MQRDNSTLKQQLQRGHTLASVLLRVLPLLLPTATMTTPPISTHQHSLQRFETLVSIMTSATAHSSSHYCQHSSTGLQLFQHCLPTRSPPRTYLSPARMPLSRSSPASLVVVLVALVVVVVVTARPPLGRVSSGRLDVAFTPIKS